MMRALGVWNDAADTVATTDWVSSNTNRLLVVDGSFVQGFQSMAEFDRFACRLLLLGLLLGRRAVIPSMPCSSRWAQNAMEPRHLRGLEVGCGKQKQCVWLPMPHFKEAWCSGIDFLYSIDYEVMVDRGEVRLDTDVAEMAASSLRLDADGGSLVLRLPPAVLRRRRDDVEVGGERHHRHERLRCRCVRRGAAEAGGEGVALEGRGRQPV